MVYVLRNTSGVSVVGVHPSAWFATMQDLEIHTA